MSNKWQELAECSEIRKVGLGRYHIVDITTPEDYEGDDYIVSLSEVDLYQAGPALLEEAWKTLGIEGDLPEDEGFRAQALYDCGYRAPMGTWTGSDEALMVKEAKKESNRLRVHKYHEQKMMEQVNRIGSTAREFMLGNLNRALVCSMTSGSVEGGILAKMYGIRTPEAVDDLRPYAHGPTRAVAISVNHGFMQRNGLEDPLAMSMGFMHALSGHGFPLDEREKKAKAYILGFQLGTDVAAGRTPMPDWAK